MDLSHIPAQPKSGFVHIAIDIPKGSKHKYEFDKTLHAFVLDWVLYSSVQYPLNYGFIPNTLADDGDPLDAMVLLDQPLFPGCVVAGRPSGMLEMIDGCDPDEKILALLNQGMNRFLKASQGLAEIYKIIPPISNASFLSFPDSSQMGSRSPLTSTLV